MNLENNANIKPYRRETSGEKQEIYRKIKEAKEQWLEEKCDEIDDLKYNKELELSPKVKKLQNFGLPMLVFDGYNVLQFDPDKQKQIWESYTVSLYSDERCPKWKQKTALYYGIKNA